MDIERLEILATDAIILGGLALALLAAPFLTAAYLGDAWLRALDLGLIFGLLAVGLQQTARRGVIDLGYVAYFALGSLAYVVLAEQLGSPAFWLLLPFGAGLAAGVGWLMGRGLAGRPTLAFLAVGLLLAEGVRLLLPTAATLAGSPVALPAAALGGFSFDGSGAIFGLEVGRLERHYFLFLIFALGAATLAPRLRRNRAEGTFPASGAMSRALLPDHYVAAGFAGFAGVCFAAFEGSVGQSDFSLLQLALIVGAVGLAGRHNTWLAVAAAMALAVVAPLLAGVQEFERVLVGQAYLALEDLRFIVYGVLLMLLPLFWPRGVLPRERAGGEPP